MWRYAVLLALGVALSAATAADELADMQAIVDALNDALEHEPTGRSLAWSNPETGNGGTVTVTRTFFRADGTPCRAYARTNGATTIEGTGCRTEIGFWRLDESGSLPAENEPW